MLKSKQPMPFEAVKQDKQAAAADLEDADQDLDIAGDDEEHR